MKSTTFYSILLLLAGTTVTKPENADVWIWYDTQMLCLQAGIWCYQLAYFENDMIYDDALRVLPIVCADNTQAIDLHVVVIEEQFFEFDDNFEPQVEIYHNCTATGNLHYMRFDLPTIYKFKLNHRYDYSVNLRNMGEDLGHHLELAQPNVTKKRFPDDLATTKRRSTGQLYAI